VTKTVVTFVLPLTHASSARGGAYFGSGNFSEGGGGRRGALNRWNMNNQPNGC